MNSVSKYCEEVKHVRFVVMVRVTFYLNIEIKKTWAFLLSRSASFCTTIKPSILNPLFVPMD